MQWAAHPSAHPQTHTHTKSKKDHTQVLKDTTGLPLSLVNILLSLGPHFWGLLKELFKVNKISNNTPGIIIKDNWAVNPYSIIIYLRSYSVPRTTCTRALMGPSSHEIYILLKKADYHCVNQEVNKVFLGSN